MSFLSLEPLINKTISPHDHLYKVYEKDYTPNDYFLSGLKQLETLDSLLNIYFQKELKYFYSIADFACHYGRMLRCMRVALPNAELYAYDIDRPAVDFCAAQFGCIPVLTDWEPEKFEVSHQHDLVICVSLLTHTDKSFFSSALKLWERMLKPGGILLFTYLGERFLDDWTAGKLDHYGRVDPSVRKQKVDEFYKSGHAFSGYDTGYSYKKQYGIGFISQEAVENEVKMFRQLTQPRRRMDTVR